MQTALVKYIAIYNHAFSQETLVHSSNSLAIQSLQCAKKDLSFFKSCVTFSEVTIPSISSPIQFDLFLETAEVGMGAFSTLNLYVLFLHLFTDSSFEFSGSILRGLGFSCRWIN